MRLRHLALALAFVPALLPAQGLRWDLGLQAGLPYQKDVDNSFGAGTGSDHVELTREPSFGLRAGLELARWRVGFSWTKARGGHSFEALKDQNGNTLASRELPTGASQWSLDADYGWRPRPALRLSLGPSLRTDFLDVSGVEARYPRLWAKGGLEWAPAPRGLLLGASLGYTPFHTPDHFDLDQGYPSKSEIRKSLMPRGELAFYAGWRF